MIRFSTGMRFFQALSFTTATATPDGLLVGTFRFSTLADASTADIVIEPVLGVYTVTQVLQPGNVDVTGELRSAGVTVLSEASLSVADVTLPAGRVGEIIVSGEINAKESNGVIITLELAPRDGAAGMVTFTLAPPPDVFQIDRPPWANQGMFTPYDTDVTGSLMLNGSSGDNALYVPEEVTYSGPLSGFPVQAQADARGIWDVRLECTIEDAVSWWDSIPEPLPTALYHGVLTVVALGDGDGSESIDVRDFSELQACFTGDIGPVDPPGYAADPALRCAVYDFDGDGDVDADDYVAFRDVMSDPGP